jgi:flagellar assembly protein FliH
MMMKNARPHRFPPLYQLVARTPAQEGPGAAEGFQQGLDQGYAEGYRSGEESGRAQGLADGHAEGVSQGRRQGREEVLAAFEGLARPLDAALDALHKLHADYQAAQRKEVVDLVAKVARQVIRGELALQPLQLLKMVDETLATLPRVADSEVEVYLHPEDHQRIVDIDPTRAQRWKLLPDPRLEPGECHVKAASHEADAGCRQRQAAVMEQISAQLEHPMEVPPGTATTDQEAA